MATIEWNDGRWIAATTTPDGDRYFEASGQTPLVAMSNLAETIAKEIGDKS